MNVDNRGEDALVRKKRHKINTDLPKRKNILKCVRSFMVTSYSPEMTACQ